MNRKDCVHTFATMPGISRSETQSGRSKKRPRMKVGSQQGGITKENLEFWTRHGVFHVDGGAPKFIPGVGWDLEDSLAKKEACEK